MSLTEKRIRDAKPGNKTAIIWDRIIVGLGLRVTPGGTKAYVLGYRIGGKKRLVTLARYGEISLAEVRDRAGRELATYSQRSGGPAATAARGDARGAGSSNGCRTDRQIPDG